MAGGSRGSSVQEAVTRGSSRGLPVPAPPASKRELLQAKRKLLFKGNVFEGERFYLDLDGYNNTKQLEADLYEMGAFVERFFNKQITKIITNKKEGNHNRNNSSTSSLSRLSSTRAAALLSKSIASSKNCDNTSIQEKAKKMGIKTVQLKVVLDIVSREKEKSANPEDLLNEVRSCPVSAPRARKLRAPYIKVEDSSCKYRPVCSNFTKLPLIDLSNVKQTTKVENLPVPKLDFNKENKGTNNTQSTAQAVSVDSKPKDISKSKNDSKAKPAKHAPAVKPKNGYCEICDAVYTDLKEHTKSDSHEQVILNNKYWSTLDEVINALPSLDSLIGNLTKNQEVIKSPILTSSVEGEDCSIISIHSDNDANNCDNVGGTRNSSISKCDQLRNTFLVTKDQNSVGGYNAGLKTLSKTNQESDSVIVIDSCDDVKKARENKGSLEKIAGVPDENSPAVFFINEPSKESLSREINNNEGSKSSKSGNGVISEDRKSASYSSISINSLAFATEAIFGNPEYGSDRSVAREIEDGLEALLECVSNITLQLQSQPSQITPSDVESNNEMTKEESEQHASDQNKISHTDLKLPPKHILTEDNSSQRKTYDEMKDEEHKTVTASQSETNAKDENIYEASEISNENFIFSSLSLVDNDYVDNMTLNDFNQEGLSVLSEITEKYVLSVPFLGDGTSMDHKNDLSLSMNQLYSFNTDSMVNQTITPSQFNEISTTIIPEKSVLPMDEDCVQSVFDKEDLKENDFSDFSEPSVVNAGLPGDTFVTIMQTLDCSEQSQATDVSPVCKSTEESHSPTKPTTLDKLSENCERSNSLTAKSNTSSQSKTETISKKLDEILKTVIQRKTKKQSVKPVEKTVGSRSENVCEKPVKSSAEAKDKHFVVKEDKITEKPEGISEVSEPEKSEGLSKRTIATNGISECAGDVTTRPTADSSSASSFDGGCSSETDESSALIAMENSDADATLCYGESSGDSQMETTPTKDIQQGESSSEIGTSERESQAFLTRSSSLPHNEDACDGMSDCPTDYDAQSTGGSFNSTLAKQAEAGTEQSLSLGYHSYSPFEDSLGTDIVPMNTTTEDQSCQSRTRECPGQSSDNLPKPAFHERRPIKLKINLKKKQCTIVNETYSGSDRSTLFKESANMTPNSRKSSTLFWAATPPTGLKLKISKLQETPKSDLRAPLFRVENTPGCQNSSAGNNSWSVHRSGGLKLKFSSSLKLEPASDHFLDSYPSTPKHRLEHSPPSQDGEKPGKRRRKLTYEPGTLRW